MTSFSYPKPSACGHELPQAQCITRSTQVTVSAPKTEPLFPSHGVRSEHCSTCAVVVLLLCRREVRAIAHAHAGKCGEIIISAVTLPACCFVVLSILAARASSRTVHRESTPGSLYALGCLSLCFQPVVALVSLLAIAGCAYRLPNTAAGDPVAHTSSLPWVEGGPGRTC